MSAARRRASRVAQGGLAALVVVAGLAFLAAYVVNLARWPSAPDRGFIMHFDLGPHVVAQTRPLGEEAGLRDGDRILSVNGAQYRTYREYLELLDLTPGQENGYLVLREGRPVAVRVPVRPLGTSIVLKHHLPTLVLGVLFLAMGVVVFLMKPWEPVSWAFLLMATLLGVLLTYTRSPYLYDPRWLNEVFRFAAFLFGAAILHLALLFPQPRPRLLRRPWWVVFPYIVAGGLAVLAVTQGDWQDVGGPMKALLFGVPMLGLVAFVASTLEIFARGRSPSSRLQALVVVTGVVIAFLVPLTEFSFTALFGTKFFPDIMYSWLPFVAAFPVSIGYAIVRHDLFEIDAIVRRTYGYILTTALVVLIYGSTVSLLNLLVGPSEIARSPFFTVGFVLGVVFLLHPLEGRIQRLVDRAFYRTRTDYRKTISAVSERMTSLLEPRLVRETILHTVVDSMFLENGMLLAATREPRRFEVTSRVPPGNEDDRVLDPVFVRLLAEEGSPVFRHEIELNPRFSEDRARLREELGALRAEVLLPILYAGELRNVLCLGSKKSGRLFTREDLDLLRTLASQGAIALENSRLFKELADSLKQVQLLETVKSNLAKFVPETVKTMVEDAENAEDIFQKRDRDLSVMFADMTGYTRLSALLPIEDVNAIIERYFGAFLDEILKHGGDVNETAGDGLMVLFQDEDPERHARAAVDTALAIQRLTRSINAERAAEGGAPVGMHIGINSGTASVGATKISGGVGMRWTYTASGPVTNIAARVGALGEEIAITAATRSRLDEDHVIEEIGPRSLKNVQQPVVVYRVRAEAGSAPPSASPAAGPEDGVAERSWEERHALGRGRFAIRGRLRSMEDGAPLPGLRIHAFDKDWARDDYLGHATSAADGSFEILFTEELFADLFEQRPDVYLIVKDERDQQELHHTRDAVRWNAEAVEHFEIGIPRARLGAAAR